MDLPPSVGRKIPDQAHGAVGGCTMRLLGVYVIETDCIVADEFDPNMVGQACQVAPAILQSEGAEAALARIEQRRLSDPSALAGGDENDLVRHPGRLGIDTESPERLSHHLRRKAKGDDQGSRGQFRRLQARSFHSRRSHPCRHEPSDRSPSKRLSRAP